MNSFPEELVACDISELQIPAWEPESPNVPFIALKGASAAQIRFASAVRAKKYTEWKPDFPDNVWKGICSISASTWWLANQDNDSASIKWPSSWLKVQRQPDLPKSSGTLSDSRNRTLAAPRGTTPKSATNDAIEEFAAFAKKACQSPELAYLTMLALMHRQTQSPVAKEKFVEVRKKIAGHLEAIDKIYGEEWDA